MDKNIYDESTKVFQKIYNSLIKTRKSRGLNKTKLDYYTEKHHIIPKCMGGKDEDDNYVLLTAKEHILAHMLLYRIYPDIDGLCYAIHLMLHIERYSEIKLSLRMAEKYRLDFANVEKKRVISKEQKLKISNSNKGKILGSPSVETRKKISESKKGMPLGRKVKAPNGIIYNTVKECAEAYNTTIGMIKHWATKRLEKGFSYTGDHSDIVSGRTKKVQGPDGTIYNSMKECSEFTKHDRHTIVDWIRYKPEKGFKFI